MPLQDQLDRITQNTRALVQPERLAISEAATAALFQTGIEDRVAPVGAQAPDFTLTDALTGKPVHLTDVLSLGAVVLKFFRGRWCPYCVTELETWRELQPEIRRRGALFVAISPQTSRQNDFTLQQHALPFPLLSDPGHGVADKFGVWGPKKNGSEGIHRTTFVIKSGKIARVFTDVKPEGHAAEVLAAL